MFSGTRRENAFDSIVILTFSVYVPGQTGEIHRIDQEQINDIWFSFHLNSIGDAFVHGFRDVVFTDETVQWCETNIASTSNTRQMCTFSSLFTLWCVAQHALDSEMLSDHVQRFKLHVHHSVLEMNATKWFLYYLCQMFHVAQITIAYSPKVSS